jgi:hypothetical protein
VERVSDKLLGSLVAVNIPYRIVPYVFFFLVYVYLTAALYEELKQVVVVAEQSVVLQQHHPPEVQLEGMSTIDENSGQWLDLFLIQRRAPVRRAATPISHLFSVEIM